MEVFAQIFRRDEMTLEELRPKRIVAAYRIVRLLARLQGLVASNEPLASAPSEWHYPRQRLRSAVSPQRDFGSSLYRLTLLLDDHPTPLLPPAPPSPLPPIYTPENPQTLPYHDPPLNHFLRIVNAAISTISPPLDAIHGLTHPAYIREAFPSRREILEFEQDLLFEALEMYADRGLFPTVAQLSVRYNLRKPESLDVIEQAKALAATITPTNTEQERALLKLRIDDYIQRARQAFDLRGEMQGLKLKALVTGVTRDEPTNPFTEFTDAVRRLSNERKNGEAPRAIGSSDQTGPADLDENG